MNETEACAIACGKFKVESQENYKAFLEAMGAPADMVETIFKASDQVSLSSLLNLIIIH